MLLRHANDDSGDFASDIAQILDEATGTAPGRRIWISHVLFGELRPSYFVPGKFKDFPEFVRYVRSIGTVITPDPNVMLRVARMRDIAWTRKEAMSDEKVRRLTLGDAMHLASALWVKEAHNVPDLEFLTFDNKAAKSIETEAGTKSLPLLKMDEFTYNIGSHPDVIALLQLPRVRPALRQSGMDFDKP